MSHPGMWNGWFFGPTLKNNAVVRKIRYSIISKYNEIPLAANNQGHLLICEPSDCVIVARIGIALRTATRTIEASKAHVHSLQRMTKTQLQLLGRGGRKR